jgi:hypothetical protein
MQVRTEFGLVCRQLRLQDGQTSRIMALVFWVAANMLELDARKQSLATEEFP